MITFDPDASYIHRNPADSNRKTSYMARKDGLHCPGKAHIHQDSVCSFPARCVTALTVAALYESAESVEPDTPAAVTDRRYSGCAIQSLSLISLSALIADG
jgi:hypothetical protein